MENKSKTTGANNKIQMDTLSSCINALTLKGFTTQFAMEENGLKSLSSEIIYRPEDIKIVSFYRFEGESDPADNSILYAIETDRNEKGTLTDAYGIYNDTRISDFINEVQEIEKKSLNKKEKGPKGKE